MTSHRSRTRRTPSAAGSGQEQHYTIGDLAEEFGVTMRAIRFYESKGLLRPKRAGKVRVYSRGDRARLLLILRGKNLGFSLEEVAEYLKLHDADPAQVTQTRHLLGKVETAMAELQKKQADIDRTLRELEQIRAKCIAHLEKQSDKG
jgi:DNA-binding transcriptional MerR regulator